MKNVKRIIGNRLLIRRLADANAITLPEGVATNRTYRATVVMVGKLDRDVRQGDTVLIERVGVQSNGAQMVQHGGEQLEMVSGLDVVAVIG